jgi:hypothetical protein
MAVGQSNYTALRRYTQNKQASTPDSVPYPFRRKQASKLRIGIRLAGNMLILEVSMRSCGPKRLGDERIFAQSSQIWFSEIDRSWSTDLVTGLLPR